ncbi:biotin transporter BioY [Pseudahrensia aquimaris]|uniref:Biotin transporter n=1 Tax=Pseudahrensia aquimaris TaxID=744461 RepID=A0ABW3FGG5_9HYPH
MSNTLANGSLAQTFIAREWANKTAGFLVMAVLGSLLLTIASKIQVPFFPVPMTLQTLAVFAIGAAYGRNLAVATVLLYLAQGFAGLPVFAGAAAGPAYFIGGTGGYLAGFVVAAFIIGTAADKGWSKSAIKMGGVILAADVVIFMLGFAWLSTLIGAEKAFTFGVVPFVLGDLVKIAIAALAVSAVWKVWKRA